MLQRVSDTPPISDDVPQQRVGGLVELPGLLRDLGVNIDAVLIAAGIATDGLSHVEKRIPFAAATALLREGAAQARCPHFALLVGQRWTLSHFGALGELMRCSATVGEALDRMAVYQRLNSDVGAVFLLRHGDTESMGYALYRTPGPDAAQVYDISMAITWNVLRELCGPRWTPSEVTFARPEPPDPAPYRQFFRAPLRFDRDRSAVWYPGQWRNVALPYADPQRCAQLIESLQPWDDGRLMSRLRRALRLLLLDGKSSGDDLAQTLSLHRRTLNRRLQAHGTTFQRVLDEVRFDVARQLLEQTAMQVCDISAALCYAETSAFTHAFRRWSGTSPLAWRRQVKRS